MRERREDRHLRSKGRSRYRRGCSRRWAGTFRLSDVMGRARRRRGRHRRSGRDWNVWI